MSIYAISDLHLSAGGEKPMDVFGEHWKDHFQRIADNWDAIVKPEDTVLITGDTSWALRLHEAKQDIDFVAQRPGRKILIRGNHDYWWRREATNRMQKEMPPGIELMHGRAIVAEGCGITGTRGWRVDVPQDPDVGDERVMRRELAYLERGLKEIPADVELRIVMLHYPPYNIDFEPNAFAELLQAYKVDLLVYGHIHVGDYLRGDIQGINYNMVAVDRVDFRPVLIV